MSEGSDSKPARPSSGRAPEIQSILAAIIDSSEDAIYSKDSDALVTSWNRSAERLYGYTEAEAVGQDIAFLIPADRRGEERVILGRILNGESIDHYETQRQAKDGSIIDVSLAVSPVRDSEGDIVGASVIGRDIRDRKRQAALEQEVEKRDFIARAAHELKNPLTTIAGMARILRDKEDSLHPDELEKVYSILIRQSDRANRLITDLLELARLESGQLDIDPIDTEISAVVAGSIEAAAVADLLPIDNRVESVQAVADPFRLEEVFVNLFSNSAKYGASSITVSSESLAEIVRIYVADDGPGIPEELVHELFEPFTRGAGSGVPGSGLGLSIARRLCEAFGGGLDLDPSTTSGTRFIITLRAS
jgi:PAS domain S-box-containing protein